MRRSIEFVVVFWGKKFRDLFLDYCLASMLAPNNLGSFKEEGLEPIDVRVIMCSTQDDYHGVTQTALYRQLLEVAEVEFIDIGMPGDDVGKMQHMSLGHKLAIERIVKRKSYGAILTPDILYADGSLRALARHIRAGTGAVLAPGLRFDLDLVVGQLRDAGVLKPDAPLVIEPRALAKIACTSLHSELKRFEYDEDHFCNHPIDTIFKDPGVGMIFHVSGWAITACDFSRIENLDIDMLDSETIDARFVEQNLKALKPVLLDDSDDFLMVPITTEDDYPLAHMVVPQPYFTSKPPEEIADERKIAFIRSFLFGIYSDEYKRQAYRTPVRIHYADLPTPDRAAARSVSIIDRALVTAPPLPKPIYFFAACHDDAERWIFDKNLASSLMAPGNAPMFAGHTGHRMFVVCDAHSKSVLINACWMLRCISNFAEVEYIDTNEAKGEALEGLIREARKSVAARSVADQAYFSDLAPNLVLSDGTLARVMELARSGHEAVLALTMPVHREPFEAKLVGTHEMFPECLLSLSARRLARNALAFTHPGLRGRAWDGAWTAPADGPLTLVHRAPGGAVVQSTAWTVLLADLGAAGVRADGPLSDDFLERALEALHARGRVHHVTDSDELAVVQLLDPPSPAAPARDDADDASPWARETAALARLAAALRAAPGPAAATLLQIPVRWHGTDTSPVWDVVAAQARSVVATADRHGAALLDARFVEKAATALPRDRALARAIHDRADGDEAIEAFVAAGHADDVVARLVDGGALSARTQPTAGRPALDRLGRRLGTAIQVARRFVCYPQVFLFGRRKAPRPDGRPLRVSNKRLRRFLASPDGAATVQRLLAAGRLDGTVERLIADGQLAPPQARGVLPTLLRWFHGPKRHDPKGMRAKTKVAG